MDKLLAKMYLEKIKNSAKAVFLLKGAKNTAYNKKELNFNKSRIYKRIKDLERAIDCLKKDDIEDMPKKLTKKGQSILEEEKITKKIRSVLKSSKSAVEKKLELFEVLEKIDFGELSTSENQR